MPRYHFDIRDRVDVVDSHGVELSGMLEAYARAEVLAATYFRDRLSVATPDPDFRIDVTDEVGVVLFVERLTGRLGRAIPGS